MTGLIADRIVVRILTAPLVEPIPMSFARLTSRRMCLVEVHADGKIGVGESWINYPEWAPAERTATILDGVAPLVLGTDVTDPAAVLERMTATLAGVGRQWGARGPIWQAMSAIDLALWDLRGRIAGMPVGALLGDARAAAPVYASGIGPTRVEELSELAASRGITAVKAKVGFGDEVDRATIAAIRRSAPALRIFADANCAWSHPEAERQARILVDEGVEWLEEPFESQDRAALARLHEATGIALAAGENTYGIDDLTALAAVPGVAHIQPDPAKSGGITTAAVLAGVLDGACRVSPHWYAGAIGLRASLAIATAFEHAGWIELDVRDNALRDGLVTEGFALDDEGSMLASRVAGLVADLDAERVAYHQIAETSRSAA
ncbi:mandelate racemase/muconate lactonizing enzyme family protein [Agrococcus baldri]|uniref:Mandelate racemase n=1 Tax=Agrococcus baldri TaxID=153730 RepID=A0AA87UR64_9MICO|nr:mandelate racemase/muconate lactonizing enzyme family protein [Agrococcus baldri]GEK79215.1 mandelate racemase [Agrococcus baldri]